MPPAITRFIHPKLVGYERGGLGAPLLLSFNSFRFRQIGKCFSDTTPHLSAAAEIARGGGECRGGMSGLISRRCWYWLWAYISEIPPTFCSFLRDFGVLSPQDYQARGKHTARQRGD